jgi:hypothetical protein
MKKSDRPGGLSHPGSKSPPPTGIDPLADLIRAAGDRFLDRPSAWALGYTRRCYLPFGAAALPPWVDTSTSVQLAAIEPSRITRGNRHCPKRQVLATRIAAYGNDVALTGTNRGGLHREAANKLTL